MLSRLVGLVAIALVGMIFLSGCGTDSPGTKALSAPDSNEETLEVTRGGVLVDTVSISDIRNLPQVTLDAGGQKLSGATLRSVLAASGVPDFESVTVSGMRQGRLVSGEIALTSEEVTDQVLLTINRRGQARFASPRIPSEKWIVDVARVAVE